MTTAEAKAIVLATHKTARCVQYVGKPLFVIDIKTTYGRPSIGRFCKTAAAAWISAAKRIAKGRGK